MVESYKILYREGSGELVEKKSRFIADLRPAVTEEDALAFIEETRKKYWDARHHCFAYIIGDRGQTARCSDDGEPSQTAGKPMMDVLAGAELHDVCAVVTRYFGGTLLGTGGLVRAYSGAVKEGLRNCVVVEKRLAVKLEITTDYNGVGKIQYIAAQEGIDTLDSRYSDKAVFTFLVPVAKEERFRAQVTEGTGARAVMQRAGQVYYGKAGEELVVF
ncbi:MAG: YigZ family protein [Clostridium sp.]|nr:YigZ family protein [Clostridium sp.]